MRTTRIIVRKADAEAPYQIAERLRDAAIGSTVEVDISRLSPASRIFVRSFARHYAGLEKMPDERALDGSVVIVVEKRKDMHEASP